MSVPCLRVGLYCVTAPKAIFARKEISFRKEILMQSLLPCLPESLWSLFCASLFLPCFLHTDTGRVKTMRNCWGLYRTVVRFRHRSCISKKTGEREGDRAAAVRPDWKCCMGSALKFRDNPDDPILIHGTAHHPTRSRCVAIAARWLSLGALWRSCFL